MVNVGSYVVLLLWSVQNGFNLVFAHAEAINCICLALKHHNPRFQRCTVCLLFKMIFILVTAKKCLSLDLGCSLPNVC